MANSENTAPGQIICSYALPALKKMPDSSYQLIMTSPPYNIGKSYEIKVSLQEYLKVQENIISQLVRVLSQDGSICWQVGNYVNKGEVFPLDIFFYEIFRAHGLKFRKRIIWTFGHGLHCKKRFSGRYETILWFTKSAEFVYEVDKNVPEDIQQIIARDWDSEIWEIPNVKSNHPEKTDHPCQFPVELVERCVLMLTRRGAKVMDPYTGVGSTVIAAEKNGRAGTGIDKESANCKKARSRLIELRAGRLKTRPINKPIYNPNKAA